MEKILEKYGALASSLITLVVYILTMSRGVMPIDAGELAASQYYFGVSHPSGYPLFNLIGFLWSKIPIGSVIFRLNLLCAIWVAFANFFMVKTLFMVIKFGVQPKKIITTSKNKTSRDVNPNLIQISLQIAASLTGVLIVAFCKTWWIQAAGVEVYSLHIALLALFFYIYIKTLYKEKTSLKDWAIVGLCLGLCLSNHLTSALAVPGAILLFALKFKWDKKFLLNGSTLALSATVVALVFYISMMANAGTSPKVNYGNVSNSEYAWRHITGWQYRAFMNGEGDKKIDPVGNFIENFNHQSGYIGWLLVAIGAIGMVIKNYKLAIFWISHFLASIIYASSYKIHDIENYFLLTYMAMAVFIGFAFYWVLSNIKSLSKHKAIAYILLFIPVYIASINYSKADQSKLSYIDDYTKLAMNSVDKNAIILSEEWDIFVSPAYYYHLVEHQRPDVTILDKGLLKRSWYHDQIKEWDRDLALRIEKEAHEFNNAVITFERAPIGEKKQSYDGNLIQSKYEAYITSILNQYKNRPVYVSAYIFDVYISQGRDVKMPANTILLPESYFFRVIPFDTINYHPLPVPAECDIKFTDVIHDTFQERMLNYMKNVLSSRVRYEMSFNRKDEARKLVQLMQTIDPKVTMPQGL